MTNNLPTGYRLRLCTDESDAKQIYEFVLELAKFSGKPDSVLTTPETLCEDGFKKSPPNFKAAFAEHVDKESWNPVGLVLWYNSYSTWKGRTVFLEDLYVRESHRRNGLGNALFKLCVEQAYKSGALRVEWVVLKWNERAKEMYLSLGAEYPEGGIWDMMRIDTNAMKKLITSSTGH